MKEKIKREFRRIIKHLLASIFGRTINYIEKYKFEQSDIISFDIFDTLVCRKCKKPENIFKLTEIKWNNNNPYKIHGFVEKRINAEVMARRDARHDEISNEISMEDIYNYLDLPLRIKEQLMKCEIDNEIEQCIPNLDMVKIYNRLLDQGYQVIITSDMYLSEGIIERILEKCGINGYSNLYLSSKYNKTKKSKQLFDLILADFNDSNRIIHIGDNVISDYLNAKKKRLEAILYVK